MRGQPGECRSGARILWVVTGAGSYLRESAGAAVLLSRHHRVTVAFTRAGYEVARVFGVLGLFRLAAPGGYYRELVVEDSASGVPVVNRVAAGRYDLVVISPASSNTIAKIVSGIADSLASSVASQALKNRVPLLVVPSERPGGSVTELPCYVDRGSCVGCLACIPVCPTGAILVAEGRARIALEHCVGCARCASSCPYSAIRCWERVTVQPSPVDLENLRSLESLGVPVLPTPWDVLRVAYEKLGLCTPRLSF